MCWMLAIFAKKKLKFYFSKNFLKHNNFIFPGISDGVQYKKADDGTEDVSKDVQRVAAAPYK